jgi:hypothetical protein
VLPSHTGRLLKASCIVLGQVFSSRTGDAVYEFPWFRRFRAALEGVLDQVTSQISMLRHSNALLGCQGTRGGWLWGPVMHAETRSTIHQ